MTLGRVVNAFVPGVILRAQIRNLHQNYLIQLPHYAYRVFQMAYYQKDQIFVINRSGGSPCLFLLCLIEGETERTPHAANRTALGLTELVLNSKTVGRFTRQLDRLRAELEAARPAVILPIPTLNLPISGRGRAGEFLDVSGGGPRPRAVPQIGATKERLLLLQRKGRFGW